MAIRNMKCLRCGEQIIKDGKLLNDAHTLKYDICKCDTKKMFEYLVMVTTHPRSFANCTKKAKELLKEIRDHLEKRKTNENSTPKKENGDIR